jgi:hypothetical protein
VCGAVDWTQGLVCVRQAAPLSYILSHYKSMYVFIFKVDFLVLFALCFLVFAFAFARTGTLLLSHASGLFCFGHFWDRVWSFTHAGLDCSTPILYFLLGWDERQVPPHPGLLFRWGLLTFSMDWSQTRILLIAASQV